MYINIYIYYKLYITIKAMYNYIYIHIYTEEHKTLTFELSVVPIS